MLGPVDLRMLLNEAITAPRPSEASIRVISLGFWIGCSNSRPCVGRLQFIETLWCGSSARRVAARTSSAISGEIARSTMV